MNALTKTIEEIIAEEKAAAYELEAAATYKGYAIARLRQTMEAVQNPVDWKAPWSAVVGTDLISQVAAAVEYFHADAARIALDYGNGTVLMYGQGYKA